MGRPLLNPSSWAVRLALTASLLGSSAGVGAQQLVVIAHPGLGLTADDVADIYLGDKQLDRSVKLLPIDNLARQERFLALTLKVDAPRYRASWARRAFRDGLAVPTARSDDPDVAEFVRRTPGAVGYIAAPAPAGVTVVSTLN